jgi:hypothetical protein
MCTGQWALAFHANGTSASERWYHVARIAYVDGKWWELHWHPDNSLRGDSEEELRKSASLQGITLLDDLFVDAPTRGAEMIRLTKESGTWSRAK